MANQTQAQYKELVIRREFDASCERVWKAWTDPEMVQRWWGPEHFTAPSIQIDLRVGGRYLYTMRGPAGTPFDVDSYSGGVFKEIVPNQKLVLTVYFSDKDGNPIDPSAYGISPDFPKEVTCTILFEEIGRNKTRLSLIYPKPESEAQYQAMLASRMTEGWNSSLNKLAEALR